MNCLDFIAVSFHGDQYASTGQSPYKMTFGCQMTLPIQLGNRWLQSTKEDEHILPAPQKKYSGRCRKSVHNLAAINISKNQAWQVKNYDPKDKGTVLIEDNKVIQFNA